VHGSCVLSPPEERFPKLSSWPPLPYSVGWKGDKTMNCKGFLSKREWHNFKVLSLNSPTGPEEKYEKPIRISGSRGSSGSIVSDYGLDDRAIGVRFPAGAKDFSSTLCVQTGSGAHPASCTMGIGVLSPGVKRGRGVTLTTHPHPVPRSWMSMSYTSSPPKRLHGV
jgi:hypothetical protein